MQSDIAIAIAQLKAWFAPEAHKERDLPGGGKWFYLQKFQEENLE